VAKENETTSIPNINNFEVFMIFFSLLIPFPKNSHRKEFFSVMSFRCGLSTADKRLANPLAQFQSFLLSATSLHKHLLSADRRAILEKAYSFTLFFHRLLRPYWLGHYPGQIRYVTSIFKQT
jgi:hypothetical protein